MPHANLRRLGVGATAAALVAAPLAGTSLAGPGGHTARAADAPIPHTKVMVKGLNGPSEVQFGRGGGIFVANRDTGDVVRAAGKGGKGKIIFHKIGNSGVMPINSTLTYTLNGEGGKRGDTLFKGNPTNGNHHRAANLLAFEKAHNPDGQKQCVGKHCDSLSNSYYVVKTTHDVLVADAGANDIVAYNAANGSLHTYHVFPNIRDTKRCKNARNNDRRHPGCDPVPTGMALGPNNTLYVSLLGAESKHAARVVELDLQTGNVIRQFRHMTSVDGVAVSPSGVVYASELEFGLNPKAPNLNKVGRIVRIANGKRTYARVPTPSGLIWNGGHLYAGVHSVDGAFAHIPNAGEVVRVSQKAFKPKK